MMRPLSVSSLALVVAALGAPLYAHTPTPPLAGDMLAGFGRAVAISGVWAFVGEPNVTMPSTRGAAVRGEAGVVHVYRKGPTGWKKVTDIVSPDGTPGDGFGSTLATDGTTLLVARVRLAGAEGGGRGGRGGGGAAAPDTTQGTVFVFRRGADDKWSAAGTLPWTANPGAQIGGALVVNGNTALVGAPAAGDSAQGSVATFTRGANGSWAFTATIPVQGLGAGDHFGSAIAMNDSRLAIGAPGYQANGAVFLYNRDAAGTWTMEGTAPLTTRRVPDGAQVGSALAFKGDRIIAGAPAAAFILSIPEPAPASAVPAAGARGGGRGGRGGPAPAVTGAVVVFEVNLAARWTDATVLTPYDFSAARFGSAVAIAGEDVLIGAPLNEGSGRVYRIAQEKNGSWGAMTRFGVDTIDMGAQFGATLAASGTSAVIGLPADGGGGGTVAFAGKGATGNWSVNSVLFPPVPDAFAAVKGKEITCATDGKASAFECKDTGLVSFLPLSALGARRGVRLSGMWGWTDPLTGKDYALVGRTDGAAFVDISDPTNPRYLGDLMRTPGSTTSGWREIKTYKNFAYIISDGSGDHHGIQIFDLTRLRTVRTPQHFTEDGHYPSGSIHDLTINTESGFGYAVGTASGGQTCSGGSHIIDLRADPKNPKFVACFADAGTGRSGRGYTHDIQCVMYHGPDKRYTGHEICLASNETHISIQDVTDKANIKVLSRATYPTAAYVHQGWFNEDQSYWYLDDELDEGGFTGTTGANGNGPNCPCGSATGGTRTLVWDMKDLTDPILAKEFIGTTHATDHNQYVKGNRLYQSNYRAGLRIIDITEPANPREVGYLDTYPYDNNKEGGGSWSNYPWFKNGLIGVVSGTEGLFLVRDNTKKTIVP